MSTSVYISDLGLCLYLRRALVCIYVCVCFFGPIGLRLFFRAYRSASVSILGLDLCLCLCLYLCRAWVCGCVYVFFSAGVCQRWEL